MINNFPFTKIFPETKSAVKAAFQAGEAVKKIYNQDFSVSRKNDNEPITEADIKSNEIIENLISQYNYPILSEESKDNKELRINSLKVWVVDPLDGTSDFVNKTGEFTIMIALVEENKPILGIIFVPLENALFVAQKDQGAFQFSGGKWARLQVNENRDLKRCKAVGSRFHKNEQEDQFLEKLKISNFTTRGSSLKVVDICSGKADLYFTFTDKIKQWDTCASNCLVTEAGGKMTDMLGMPLKYNIEKLNHQNGILVTNGFIHNELTQGYSEFLNY